MPEILRSLNNVKPKNATEKVYLELKKMLFTYQIVPGQKLQYQDLAERFNVSRTPVKDALKMMEKEGLVELKPNRGYYVEEIGPKEIEELFDVRAALEILAVRGAIANQTPESLKELKQTMKSYAEDVGRPLSRGRLLLDEDFHVAIAKVSQNKTLVEMLERIFSKIYLRHRVENLSQKRGNIAKGEHEEIYQLIIIKNVSAAVSRMQTHIAASRKNILGTYQEDNGTRDASWVFR